MPGLHTPGQRSEGDARSFVAVKTNCCWQGSSPGLPQGRMRLSVGGSEPGWARRWFLVEFDGQEKGSPGLSRSGAGLQQECNSSCPPGSWGLAGSFHLQRHLFVVLLIVINILPFPQSFCKKRAGFTSSLVFCLSHPWAGKRQWGTLGSWSRWWRESKGRFAAGHRIFGFGDSLEPQLGDRATSVTWLPLW